MEACGKVTTGTVFTKLLCVGSYRTDRVMFYVRKMTKGVYNSVMYYVCKSVMFYVLWPRNDTGCVQQCDVLYPHKWHRVCAITWCIMSTKWHRVCTTVWCFISAKMTLGSTTMWFLCPQNDIGCVQQYDFCVHKMTQGVFTTLWCFMSAKVWCFMSAK